MVFAPAVPVADWTGRRVVLHGQWHEARLWLDNVTEEDRLMRGHFDERHHFAFEAAAWYWHFVDVVWLVLFVCVYWL